MITCYRCGEPTVISPCTACKQLEELQKRNEREAKQAKEQAESDRRQREDDRRHREEMEFYERQRIALDSMQNEFVREELKRQTKILKESTVSLRYKRSYTINIVCI